MSGVWRAGNGFSLGNEGIACWLAGLHFGKEIVSFDEPLTAPAAGTCIVCVVLCGRNGDEQGM